MKLIDTSKMVLEVCNGLRINLEVVLSEGTNWRDHAKETRDLFETINALEHAAFGLIEGADAIRQRNDLYAESYSDA